MGVEMAEVSLEAGGDRSFFPLWPTCSHPEGRNVAFPLSLSLCQVQNHFVGRDKMGSHPMFVHGSTRVFPARG